MNKQEFLQRFLLQTKTQPVKDFPYPGKLKPSAVLIPIVERQGKLSVLLTKRASHLNNHAGQISFPGGRFDDTDSSLTETALRESEEEIGLCQSQVQLVGHLHDFRTISGFMVTPVVGLLPESYQIDINHQEVEEVFEMPLEHLFDESNILTKHIQRGGFTHTLYLVPYQQWTVWGVTAALLVDLVNHLQN